jgi:hypothetical protein
LTLSLFFFPKSSPPNSQTKPELEKTLTNLLQLGKTEIQIRRIRLLTENR